MSVEERPESPRSIAITPAPTPYSINEETRITDRFDKLPKRVQNVLQRIGDRVPFLRRAAYGDLSIPLRIPTRKR